MIEPNFYLQILEYIIGRYNEKHKLCPMMLCVSQLNTELVYSILQGVSLFSNVCFSGDTSEFYRKTTGEI